MKLLTPLLLLVVSFGTFYWYISPTYYATADLRDQNNQYTAGLESARLAQIKLSTLTSEYNNFSTDNLNRLQTALPDAVDPVRLVIDITAIAQKYGVPLQGISVTNQPLSNSNAPTDTSTIVATPLTFSISLTYQNLLKFLNDLEQNLKITDISGVQFTPNDTNIYTYTISINSYSLK
jgi:hypothetical protein